MALELAGLAVAIASSAIFAIGVALQALAAGRQTAAVRPTTLLARLSRQPTWLYGTAITVVAWLLQACALALAPLTLVQPALATQVVWLAAISERVLGQRPGRKEVWATGTIAVGLAGTAWAAPGHSTHHVAGSRPVVTLAILASIALLPQLLARSAAARPLAASACAGLAYAWTGIASKLGVDDLAHGAVVQAGAWGAAILAVSLVAIGNEMAALRTRRAGRVIPIIIALEILVPVLLAPLLTHEHWNGTPGGGSILLASVVLVAIGAVVIARDPGGAQRADGR